MSDQPPPYGQQPYQQPAPQPGQPYGHNPYQQTPYGQPYAAGQPPYLQQQPKNHTTRNVILIVVAVVVLVCGGLVAAVVAVVDKAQDEFDRTFDTSYRGSEEDPLTVGVGEAFEIRGFEYAAGWTVGSGQTPLRGLVVTNERDEAGAESVSVTFSFSRGTEVLDEISCRSSAELRQGQSKILACVGGYEGVTDFDTVTVHDNSLFE